MTNLGAGVAGWFLWATSGRLVVLEGNLTGEKVSGWALYIYEVAEPGVNSIKIP